MNDRLGMRKLDTFKHKFVKYFGRKDFSFGTIVTCSLDQSILATDLETGSAIARLEDAHSAAINRLINLSEAIIASGDDEGCIKVWDTRQRSCCNTFAAHQDYISDMSFASNSLKLLGTRSKLSLSFLKMNYSVVLMKVAFVLTFKYWICFFNLP
ncbi:hypothetical protein SO802_032371 [Lithocarpus litseifolius]|uniref:Uncharacterized protein n=1 Tax=Lithocarpus litseifolius TaxID=425828 RepID=A0AAW2BTQ6_9ROSI